MLEHLKFFNDNIYFAVLDGCKEIVSFSCWNLLMSELEVSPKFVSFCQIVIRKRRDKRKKSFISNKLHKLTECSAAGSLQWFCVDYLMNSVITKTIQYTNIAVYSKFGINSLKGRSYSNMCLDNVHARSKRNSKNTKMQTLSYQSTDNSEL